MQCIADRDSGVVGDNEGYDGNGYGGGYSNAGVAGGGIAVMGGWVMVESRVYTLALLPVPNPLRISDKRFHDRALIQRL